MPHARRRAGDQSTTLAGNGAEEMKLAANTLSSSAKRFCRAVLRRSRAHRTAEPESSCKNVMHESPRANENEVGTTVAGNGNATTSWTSSGPKAPGAEVAPWGASVSIE